MVLYYSCNCRADQIRKPPANQTLVRGHDRGEKGLACADGVVAREIHSMPFSASARATTVAAPVSTRTATHVRSDLEDDRPTRLARLLTGVGYAIDLHPALVEQGDDPAVVREHEGRLGLHQQGH